MSRYTKSIAAVCGMAAMAGCSVNKPFPEATLVPAMQVRHSHDSAQGYYALGRYYHGAGRLDNALKAYQSALELEPAQLNVRNAMAIIHAGRGDYPKAVSLLRDMAGTTPDTSYTYSNLGYIYLLQGDYKNAEAALETATALDAANVRAWNNLGRVMERTGRNEQAHRIYAHAQSLERNARGGGVSVARSGDKKMEKGAPRGGSTMRQAATGSFLGSTSASMDKIGRTEIQEVAQGIYEARRSVSGDRTDSVTAEDKSTSAAAARLEISNGNGVTGMAKSLAGLINGGGVQVVRLTNQQHFRIVSTRIEYKAGYEAAARRLAHGLGQDVAIKPSGMGSAVDMRLVLGRDMVNTKTVHHDRMQRPDIVADAASVRH